MSDKARNKLQKYIEKNYSIDEQDEMAFYVDQETDDCYIWTFDLYGDTIRLYFDYKTGNITREIN